MKGLANVSLREALLGLGLLLLFGGCQSSGEFPLSRREYDYVPPEMPEATPVPTATPLPTPTPAPTPTPEPAPETEPTVEEPEAMEENSAGDGEVGEVTEADAPKKGLFSRWFSRKPESEPVEIERVGDRQAQAENGDNPGGVNGPNENLYRLKAGDAVYISLTGSGELSEQIETIVDGEGAVKLRYIGSVKATGLSTTELEREIELEYTERQKIYRNVTARVVVPNKFYFIGGEVRQPGKFPIVGRVTLSQAVVAAGNFTEWANEKKIVLVRNNERVELDFRVISRNPLQDVELLPGDVVTVSRSTL